MVSAVAPAAVLVYGVTQPPYRLAQAQPVKPVVSDVMAVVWRCCSTSSVHRSELQPFMRHALGCSVTGEGGLRENERHHYCAECDSRYDSLRSC